MPTGGIDLGALAGSIFGGAGAAGAGAAGTAAGLGAADAALTLPEVAVTAAAPAAATGAGLGLGAADLGTAALGAGSGIAAGLGGASAPALGGQLAALPSTTVSDSLPAAPVSSGGGVSGPTGVPGASAGAGGPANPTDINIAAAGGPDLPGGVSNAMGPNSGFTPTGIPSLDSTLGGFAQSQSQNDLASLVSADPTGTGASSFGDKLSGFGGDALNFAKSNPGAVLGGAGILGSLLMNNSIPGLSALQSQEQLLAGQGAANIAAAQTGQIPGGQQATLDASERAAEAATRSSFGREGIGGSTMENQSLVGG